MDTWDRFERVLDKYAPELLASFRPAATIEQVRVAEEAMEVEFHAELRAAYLRHDGSQPDRWTKDEPSRCIATACLFPTMNRWCSL
jgi:cell wall assembly regulator SMI1